MTTTIRSRKVRRILRLHAQADRQALREARASTRATLLGRRALVLRTEARDLEMSLNGTQRSELARARACTAPTSPAPPPARMRRRAGEAPRCPVTHLEPPSADRAAGSTEA
jgi:hypothetical protein